MRPSLSLLPFAALATIAMIGVRLYVGRPQQQSDGLQPVGTAGEGAVGAADRLPRRSDRGSDPGANASAVDSAASAPMVLESAPTEVVSIEAIADGASAPRARCARGRCM